MLDGVRSGWNRGDAEYSHEVDGEQTRRSSIFIHAARASQSANWSDRLRSSALRRWIKESYVGVICSGSGSRGVGVRLRRSDDPGRLLPEKRQGLQRASGVNDAMVRRHHGSVRVSSADCAQLLPQDAGEWQQVLGGESGALVLVDRAHGRYAKIVSSARLAELVDERDRTDWLSHTDIPCAAVLDWRESSAGACLVTQAVDGVPASELDAAALRRAWPSMVQMLRDLHSIATDQCPFDRGLGHMLSLAEPTVAEGRVVVEFLPAALQHTPPGQILEQIKAEVPIRLAQERAGLVVCHGDLCLPNVLLDPVTGKVQGLIDLARLGKADPYGDIALLIATARHHWSDQAIVARAEEEFGRIYGAELDPDRLDFYLRLDPLTW
jgi:streptomycin 3"-kinase